MSGDEEKTWPKGEAVSSLPWDTVKKPLSNVAQILGIEPRNKPTPIKKRAKLKQLFKDIADAKIIGFHIGEDVFRGETMCAAYGDDASKLRPFTDNDATYIRAKLQELGRNATKDDVRAAVNVVAEEHSFDSQADWINRLKRIDSVERCPNFLHTYFGAEDTPYTRAVSLYLWTALAGRSLNPACQADMVPVLVSTQGDGKSTGLAAMAPKPDLFAEIDISLKDDDLSRLIFGCVLGELPELRGYGTRDIEHVKAVITRKYEKWVPKYLERARIYKRRIVFVGTTNKNEFLADETGERRFLPVATGKVDVDAIKRDRDQLWAEARDLYRAVGIAYALAEELGRTVTTQYKVSDAWEPLIDNWLQRGDGLDGSGALHGAMLFTIAEVATGALGIEARSLTTATAMRIGKTLNGLGYQSKQRRVNGIKAKFWAKVAS